jgi:hypothetical protein
MNLTFYNFIYATKDTYKAGSKNKVRQVENKRPPAIAIAKGLNIRMLLNINGITPRIVVKEVNITGFKRF